MKLLEYNKSTIKLKENKPPRLAKLNFMYDSPQRAFAKEFRSGAFKTKDLGGTAESPKDIVENIESWLVDYFLTKPDVKGHFKYTGDSADFEKELLEYISEIYLLKNKKGLNLKSKDSHGNEIDIGNMYFLIKNIQMLWKEKKFSGTVPLEWAKKMYSDTKSESANLDSAIENAMKDLDQPFDKLTALLKKKYITTKAEENKYSGTEGYMKVKFHTALDKIHTYFKKIKNPMADFRQGEKVGEVDWRI